MIDQLHPATSPSTAPDTKRKQDARKERKHTVSTPAPRHPIRKAPQRHVIRKPKTRRVQLDNPL